MESRERNENENLNQIAIILHSKSNKNNEKQSTTSIGTIHAPQFDLPIVGARNNQRRAPVEGCPIHATGVALEDMLDRNIGSPEHVLIVLSRNLLRNGHILLAKTREIPDAHALVERRGQNEVVFRVELGAHDIVIVARQHGNALTRLPVPNANRLVVGRGQDPRIFVVELNSANVIEVTKQVEQASSQCVVPHFDLVVVATRHKQRLRRVKVHATHGT